MLGKLFRYEVKATSRMIVPFYVGLLGMTVLFRIFSVFSLPRELYTFQQVMSGLAVATFIVLLISTAVVGFIIMITRFYKNLYTDEGYLMNTLPVTPAQNIWAKALCSAMWALISALVSILTGFIFFFGDYLPQVGRGFGELYRAFCDELLPYLTATDGLWIAVICVEIVLMVLLGLISAPIFSYACISIGQKMTRHKILGAFGAYLVFVLILQTLSGITGAVIGQTGLLHSFSNFMMEYPAGGTALIMGGVFVGQGILCAIYFLITNHLLSRQLNLE